MGLDELMERADARKSAALVPPTQERRFSPNIVLTGRLTSQNAQRIQKCLQEECIKRMQEIRAHRT